MIERKGERFYVRIVVDGDRIPLGACATRAEAEELEAAGYQQARAKPEHMTVGKWGEEWLDARELDRLRAVRTDRGRWAEHVAGTALARMPIALVSPDDVSKWIAQLRKKRTATPHRKATGLAPKTIREAVQLLANAFDDAIAKRHVGANPVRPAWKQHRAALGRIQSERHAQQAPWTYLLVEEQRALLGCATIPEPHRLMMAFAIFTGLRQGEQFNLELRDVDVDGERPAIFVRWGGRNKPPKNGSTRTVLLSSDARAVVKRWLELLPSWTERNPHGLLFPTHTGCRVGYGKTPLHVSEGGRGRQRKVNLLPRYLEAAGIERPFRWHDFRHTCASSLVSGFWGRRWSLEEVQAFMGHESRQSTERYAHLAEGAVERALLATSIRALPAPEIRHEVVPNAGRVKGQRQRATPRDRSVGPRGLEPRTYGLKARSSTD